MGVTAKARASTALVGETSLSPEDVLNLIKEKAGKVKTSGMRTLNTGLYDIGATVNVMRESGSSLTLSLTSGKKLVELCTFPAAAVNGGDRTKVTIGGLSTYKTSQQKILFFIPAGPKTIFGMSKYKQFLEDTRDAIVAADPSASLRIEQLAG